MVIAGGGCVVVAVNEEAMRRTEKINTDCYGEGWLAIVKPSVEDWREGLVTGNEISAAYEAWMEQEAFAGCGKG